MTRLIPTHQILNEDQTDFVTTFIALLENKTVTFRSCSETAVKLRKTNQNIDWSRHIFLTEDVLEHGIPAYDKTTLHMFIHAKNESRGVECYVQLVPKGTVIIS